MEKIVAILHEKLRQKMRQNCGKIVQNMRENCAYVVTFTKKTYLRIFE